MFQLNGYKNDEWNRWLKKNPSTQRLLLAAIIPAAFSQFTLAALIISALVSIVLLINYLSFEKAATKKKLVFTPRVKRLTATMALLLATINALVFVVIPMFLTWHQPRRFG